MNRHKRQMDSYLNDLVPNRTAPETRFCPYCGHDLEVSMTFCPYCGADLSELDEMVTGTGHLDSESGSTDPVPVPPVPATLTHYPDLEEESQAKIGTFERLYGQYKTEAYGYSFNTKDYAPLVNALAAVVEIETNLSVYQLLRALHGVDMRRKFDKDCRGARSIERDNKRIELSEKRQMLGSLCICTRMFKSELQRYLPEIGELARMLPIINNIRRKASHGGVIDGGTFEKFYEEDFITFYKTLLPQLLRLKSDLRSGRVGVRDTYSAGGTGIGHLAPDFGSTAPVPANPVPATPPRDYSRYKGLEDRDYLAGIQGIFDDCDGAKGDTLTGCHASQYGSTDPVPAPPQDDRLYDSGEALDSWGRICKGVILTNSEKLSLKYHENINVQGEEGLQSFVQCITKPIQQYIELSQAGGNDYVLMDMSSPEYAHYIQREFTWQKHLEALDDFARVHGISNRNPWGLFIIGGDDVIPMPRVDNPANIFYRRDKVKALEADVDTDVPYAFSADEIVVGETGDLKYDTLLHRTAGPRFIVGRLPMETGLMETDFSNLDGTGDFDIYTKKMLARYLHVDLETMQQEAAPGLDVTNVLSVVGERFFDRARLCISGLPMLCRGDEQGLAHEGYFVSPVLDVLSEDSSRNKPYLERIKQADLLLYVAHGSATNSEEGTGFKGESIKGDCQPMVLTTEIVRTTSASILAPVSCWGARFINYRRERSMLLTAIYESGILTFFGSSRSAHAAPENIFGGAEGLQNIFAHYVLQGLPVGECMVRAKYEMLHTMTDPSVQSLSNLLCFVEFNLFGDPLLRANAIEQRHNVADDVRTPGMKVSDIGLIDEDLKTIAEEYNKSDGYSNYVRKDDNGGSILERLRNMVNNNLADIRKVVDKHLYEEYGVEPRTLATIHRMQTSEGAPIHIFCYSKTEDVVRKHTIAYVNDNGTIRSVIRTI